MTPQQERKIERIKARGRVDHIDRWSLPPEIRSDFDQAFEENIPQTVPVIIKFAQSKRRSIFWYRDWCYET